MTPSHPSLAKYVLGPITYNIFISSYKTMPLTDLAAFQGIDEVGQTLTSGELSPPGATASYQWQRSDFADRDYINIDGATSYTYTLTTADFGKFIRLSATGTGVYTETVLSPYKGPVAAKTISGAAIPGVSPPITGNYASTSLPDTEEYSAQISWDPSPIDGVFQPATQYTAYITIEPKLGYTLIGIGQNFFEVVGADTVTNASDSGYVTAVFPNTGRIPVTAIGPIGGIPQVHETLTAGDRTPSDATVSYQWMKSSTANGTYENIDGATGSTYVLTAGDSSYYIKLKVTGQDTYSGTVISAYSGPVMPRPISQPAISGVSVPVMGLDGSLYVTTTEEYTGSISWSPALVGGKFEGNENYTATITLTPKTGYTLEGVPADFFEVDGSSAVTNAANSGVVTATFPNTTTTPVTYIAASSGLSMVGQTLTAGAVTPSGATVTYQWVRSSYANGPYEDISGATSNAYTSTAEDWNKYICVIATGTDDYSGTVTSPYKGPIKAKTIDISYAVISPSPATGNAAASAIAETSQFTGTVVWAPMLSEGRFAANTEYTATITISPKTGYRLDGIPAGFFMVPGATYASNAADSGTITAVFPNTDKTPVTAIGTTSGNAEVAQTLTAGGLTPSEASVTYQWLRSTTAGGPYTAIVGAQSTAYTLTCDDLNAYISVLVTGTGDYSGSANSADVGPVSAKTVSIYPISGLPVPAAGGMAANEVTANVQYTGTITWSPELVDGRFSAGGTYTATITLLPRKGYTLTGVPPNCFTVDGATTVVNSANSGTITAVFPATETIALTAIGGTNGVSQVGQTLTAGALTPSGATATYQWQRSANPGGPYSDISGASSSTYSLQLVDRGYYIRLVATGTGDYGGTLYSSYKGPVAPKTISITSIASYNSFPITGNTAAYEIIANAEYSGTIVWQPALADGKFEPNTIYTALVTIVPNPGYTTEGIRANFFTVNGSTSVTNEAGSNLVTVVFPDTGKTPVTGVSGVIGTARVGYTLTAGALTPADATVEYQWQISPTANGTYIDVPDARQGSYTPIVSDLNKYFRVLVSGTGEYSGRAYSPYKGPVERSPYTISQIAGVNVPMNNAVAQTTIPDTDQYTGVISWSPALNSGKFSGGVSYTATITLTPKTGYTEAGVPKNFFTVPGAASCTSNLNSGIIVASFPATGFLQLHSIAGITGSESIGSTLKAGALNPAGATVSHQWQRSTTANGTYAPIEGATSDTYIVTVADVGYYLKVVATGTGSYSGVAVSPYKGPVQLARISIPAITGIGVPIRGGTAATSITETSQYVGGLSWDPLPIGGVFQAETVYRALVTIEPKPGYTLSGLPANYFTVAGATSATLDANTRMVTAVFPGTDLTPITDIAGIDGIDQVNRTLTAGEVTPLGASVTYQWQKSASPGGEYTNIPGATGRTYTVVSHYCNLYIRVVASGTGSYAGSVTSPYKGPISAAPISRASIAGLTAPVEGETAVTALPTNGEYQATVSWSPQPVNGIFGINQDYRATVTLIPSLGYTTNGVPADFFMVNGAISVSNSANSQYVTVTFPSTYYTPLTGISAPSGTPRVGSTLAVGSSTPVDATATYQWQVSSTAEGPFTSVPGATGASYSLAVADFGHYVRVRATGTGQYRGVVFSEPIGPVEEGPVTLQDILGVDFPQNGAAPVSVITETDQYSGAVSWSPEPPEGLFAGNTSYMANIVLTPKYGYTMVGVPQDFFTVASASATNEADTGVVQAMFPSTDLTPVSEISGIGGIERVGQRLIAGALTPASATATYQWKKASTPGGDYVSVPGATAPTYTLAAADYGQYFKVEATGSNDYYGFVISPYRGPIQPAPISIAEIGGITFPVLNAVAPTAVTETDQYTGTIVWSQALSNGKFMGNTEYTAIVTLDPKPGYTVAGVPKDFYTVMGATSATHEAGSGIITVRFPSTDLTPITAMGAIVGVPQVDQTLVAGDLTPSDSTAAYKWQWSSNSGGPFVDIIGATSSSYTLTAGDYNRYIRVEVAGSGGFSGVVRSESVGPVAPNVVNISTVEGIPVPVKGMAPVFTVTETSQFTGAVTWSPNPAQNNGVFKWNAEYIATITLTPKPGYTLNGVSANFFAVVGATTTTNSANSGIITATYPKTKSEPIVSIDPIYGLPVVGDTLQAGAVTPTGAIVVHQWWRCSTPEGTYSSIPGAASSSYVLTPDDLGQYIKVSVTGTNGFIGDIYSPYKGPTQPATVSLNLIDGVTPPATGETPVSTLAATNEYTLSISWSPYMPDGVFEENTIYTASITVTPKYGYTIEGVPEDFFSVPGASFAINAAGSGSVLADFPRTETMALKGMSVPMLVEQPLFTGQLVESDTLPVETSLAEERKDTEEAPQATTDVPE